MRMSRSVLRFGSVLCSSLLLLRAQNAPTSVPSNVGLINDPTPFYTTAVVNGVRSLVTVRFTNWGTAVKVVTDPILKFGAESVSLAGVPKADKAIREGGGFPAIDPDPAFEPWPSDLDPWDPWDLPDPIDDIPWPDPPLSPDPWDDPFDLPDPVDFPPIPDDIPPIDPIPPPLPDDGLPLGYIVAPTVQPEDIDPSSKGRAAVIGETDDAPWDPPIREHQVATTVRDAGAVQVLQPGQGGRVLATINAGAKPSSVVRGPDKTTLYVSNNGSRNLMIIQNNRIAKTIPMPGAAIPDAIIVTADMKKAFVANVARAAGSVVVLDLVNGTTIASVPTGIYPTGMALTADGSQLWVSSYRDGNVTVIDTATNTALGQILNIRQARGIAMNRNSTRAYVCSPIDNLLYVIDTATWNIVARIPTGSQPQLVKVSPLGRHIFVTNYGDDTISQIDARTGQLVRNITVGKAPIGLSFILK